MVRKFPLKQAKKEYESCRVYTISLEGGKSMKLIIDRFEGEYAVCEKENSEMLDIEVDKLPQNAKEGDVLIFDGENIKIDKKAISKRKKEIENLMDDLWK